MSGIDAEFFVAESTVRRDHVDEHGVVESLIHGGGELDQFVAREAAAEGVYICEISKLGSAEQRENLATGQVARRECWPKNARARESSWCGVDTQVHEELVVVVPNHKANERLGISRGANRPTPRDARGLEGAANVLHRVALDVEEIEVFCRPLGETQREQRCASCSRNPSLSARPKNTVATSIWKFVGPGLSPVIVASLVDQWLPRASHLTRQDQVVPQVHQ